METLPSPACTLAATAALEAWFAQRLRPELLDGADAAEVRADLTAHLHEELAATGAGTVTSEILAATLARMGEPSPAPRPPAEVPRPALTVTIPVRASFRHPSFFLLLAVTLPLFAWFIEAGSHWCASIIFDPLPTLWHHLFVLTAPVSAIFAWKATRAGAPVSVRCLKGASWLTGAGLAAAAYYTLLFAPFTPYAVFGIIFFGAGLLPLSALASFLSLLRARKILAGRRLLDGVRMQSPGLRGFLGMAALMLLVETPHFITRLGIHRAANSGGNPDEVASAARLIRRFGSTAALLRACYDSGSPRMFERAAPDPASWIAEWLGLDRGLTNWQFKRGWESDDVITRDLYFRVTGQPFNAVPPPRNGPTSHGALRQWDMARGGAAVAGQLDGLSLAESRLDWHCEGASGLTWGEWTFTFSNNTGEAQEARCRVALPPDGFVSRVVLWVNGEPREAAFGATPQVRAAYKSVAIAQRRDPVLVTQPDAGSIMLQAFPVPARGTLKTRLTFTAPASDGRVWLPAITERNFAISEQFHAPLWVQADAGTLASSFTDSRATPDQGWQTLTASPGPAELTGSGSFFTWKADRAPVVCCENPFAAPAQRILVRKAAAAPTALTGAVAWVLDGSSCMNSFAAQIADAMASARGSSAARLFIAGDSPSGLVTTDKPAEAAGYDFTGGCDNTPALTAALDWLRGQPNATLVWLHGPQPVVSRSTQQLEQLLERSPQDILVLDVPLTPGENTLLPVLTRSHHLRCRIARCNASAPFHAGLLTESAAAFTWEQHPALPEGLATVKVSDTLARQFALTEYRRLRPDDYNAALVTAVKASLVTSDTGAVVLERAADYTANNLAQASSKAAQQVPILPEPSTALLAVTAAFLLATRRRHSSVTAASVAVSSPTGDPPPL